MAAILYEAAEDGGYAGQTDVEEIFGVSKEEAETCRLTAERQSGQISSMQMTPRQIVRLAAIIEPKCHGNHRTRLYGHR